MRHRGNRSHVACFGGSLGFTRFRSTWPLFARGVFFGEALLAGFALPVVVTHSTAVDDEPAAKLAKHRSGGDDGDLAGAIGVGKDLLLDEVVLFGLVRNDLMQRAVFVEEQIRIAVA